MSNPRIWIGFYIAFTVYAVSGRTAAGESEKASDDTALQCFEEGVRLFNTAQYGKAADKFREANRLKPSWKINYNIGQSEAAAKRYGLALEAFEQFLSEGGDEIGDARRDQVLAEVERLRKMVGFLRIAAPEGTEIYIDGELRGKAPINTLLPVSSGVLHPVSGELDGEMYYSEDVRVIGGKTIDVDMGRAAEAATVETSEGPDAPEESSGAEQADVAPPPPIMPEKKPFPFGVVGWALSGVGAAAAIAGGVVGGLALSKNKDTAEYCGDDPCPEKAGDVETQNKMGTASTALLAAGGTVLASGVVLLVVGQLQKKKRVETASVAVFTDGRSAGASIAVRF